MPPGVSVVIPSYRGAKALAVTVESLAAQTLLPDNFEAVVVVNGPAAEDIGAFESLRERFAELQIRIILTAQAGASLAWNLGIQAARMEWLTFLDDDDTVSPRFLESLLALAEPGIVPLAEIHDQRPDGTFDRCSRLNTLISAAAGARRTAGQLPQALGFNAAKLIPTRWAKAAAFDLDMTNGQDVGYFGTLAMDHEIVFAVPARGSGAVYERGLSDRSMSRQESNFAFSVEQRLQVIDQLDRASLRATRGRRAVASHLIAAQAYLINRYLVVHPNQRKDVLAAIDAHRLQSFPYGVLNRGMATTLAIVDDGERVSRRTLRKLTRLLGAGQPIDLVAISGQTPQRSWIGKLWLSSEFATLEGRVAHVELPLAQALRRCGELLDPSFAYRDIVCVGQSSACRRLTAALRKGESQGIEA